MINLTYVFFSNTKYQIRIVLEFFFFIEISKKQVKSTKIENL